MLRGNRNIDGFRSRDRLVEMKSTGPGAPKRPPKTRTESISTGAPPGITTANRFAVLAEETTEAVGTATHPQAQSDTLSYSTSHNFPPAHVAPGTHSKPKADSSSSANPVLVIGEARSADQTQTQTDNPVGNTDVLPTNELMSSQHESVTEHEDSTDNECSQSLINPVGVDHTDSGTLSRGSVHSVPQATPHNGHSRGRGRGSVSVRATPKTSRTIKAKPKKKAPRGGKVSIPRQMHSDNAQPASSAGTAFSGTGNPPLPAGTASSDTGTQQPPATDDPHPNSNTHGSRA